jgi:hypothetical protein
MKRTNGNKYSSVTSFKDLKREKELLMLRSRLLDMKLSLDFMDLKRGLSPSRLFSSLAKEYFLPEIAALLFNIAGKKKD